MPRPTDLFSFADSTLNNGTFSTPNKKAPSATKLQEGFLIEALHRGELNYLFNQIGQWIQYFDEDIGGRRISFGNSSVNIPQIDGNAVTTINNQLKQTITPSQHIVDNDMIVRNAALATTISMNRATGNISAAQFTGALAGNASTSSKLQSAFNLNLTGAATGNVNVDGSGNVDLAVTVDPTKHTHTLDHISDAGTMAGLTKGDGGLNFRNNDENDTRFRNASNLNAGTVPVARMPEASAAQTEAGTDGVFPDAASVSSKYLKKSGNFSGIADIRAAREALGIYTGNMYSSSPAATLPAGWSITRTAIGRFRLNHTLGNKSFSMAFEAYGNDGQYVKFIHGERENGWVDIYTRSANQTLSDTPFSFIFILTTS